MDDRLVKAIGALLALGLVLFVGAAVGGVLVYGLIRLDPLSVAQAQAGDPGYGVVIAHVEPDSPAEDAGAVRGDILLEIDGIALDKPHELGLRLSEYEAGDEVELTLLHGDEQRTLTAVLGARPDGAYLGMYPCAVQTAPVWIERETAGTVITEVLPDSPAEEAGLAAGDMLLAIGTERLHAGADLADAIAGYGPGDYVAVELETAEGERRTVDVNLGEHPDDEDRAYLGVRYSSGQELRHFEWSIPPLAEEEHLPPFTMPYSMPHGVAVEGLMILHIAEDSPASESGLWPGDIITAVDGEKVTSPEELAKIIAGSKRGDTIWLTVGRIGSTDVGEVDVILGEDPDEEGKPYLGVTVWPVPDAETLEGDLPHFWRHEEFGLDDLPFLLPQGTHVQGVIVVSVEEGSPADLAGLGEGDVITAVDGEPVDGPKVLVDLVADLEPGDELVLAMVDEEGDAGREIEVTLGEHPDEKGKPYLGVEIGAYFRMERRGSLERPYRHDHDRERFHFRLPRGGFPFDLEELPHRFDFPWAPGEEDCEGEGCSHDSA